LLRKPRLYQRCSAEEEGGEEGRGREGGGEEGRGREGGGEEG
jgi:hypothetical protein